MTRSRSVQALKYLGSSLLLLCVFEACSGDDADTPNPFTAPPTLEISSVSLGNGSIGQGGDSSVLACDETIGVTLAISNWDAYPPGKCGTTPQCGQIRVSLLDSKGAELVTQSSSGLGANLAIAELVANGTVKAGSYAVEAELVDDAGRVYPVADGGNSTAKQAFNLSLADGCPSGGAGASSGGASGEGGMGGAFFEAGGFGGAPAGAGGTPSP